MEEQKSFREELVNALLNAVQVENKISEAKKMVDALIKEFPDESTQLHKSLEEISSNVNSAAISMWSIVDVLKAMAIRDDMPAASNDFVSMDAIIEFLLSLRNKAEEQAKRDDPDTESK